MTEDRPRRIPVFNIAAVGRAAFWERPRSLAILLAAVAVLTAPVAFTFGKAVREAQSPVVIVLQTPPGWTAQPGPEQPAAGKQSSQAEITLREDEDG